jgi:hypothetical protein
MVRAAGAFFQEILTAKSQKAKKGRIREGCLLLAFLFDFFSLN